MPRNEIHINASYDPADGEETRSVIRETLVSVIEAAPRWMGRDEIELLMEQALDNEFPVGSEWDRCPECGSVLGHRINCPAGIAFSRNTKP